MQEKAALDREEVLMNEIVDEVVVELEEVGDLVMMVQNAQPQQAQQAEHAEYAEQGD